MQKLAALQKEVEEIEMLKLYLLAHGGHTNHLVQQKSGHGLMAIDYYKDKRWEELT